MFEHANRHECIARAADISVIIFDELDSILQPLVARPTSRIVDLLLGDVERAHFGAVMAGDVQSQTAPAASGLHHRICARDPQLTETMVHLSELPLIGAPLRAGMGG